MIILQEASWTLHYSMAQAVVAGGSNFLALLTFLIPPVLNLQGFIPSYYSHTLCDLIARPYLKLRKLTTPATATCIKLAGCGKFRFLCSTLDTYDFMEKSTKNCDLHKIRFMKDICNTYYLDILGNVHAVCRF